MSNIKRKKIDAKPNDNATKYQYGYSKLGKDGNKWQVIKSGDTKKWSKVPEYKGFKKYYTREYGRKGFLVFIKGKTVYIYENESSKINFSEIYCDYYVKLIKKYTNVDKIFIGIDYNARDKFSLSKREGLGNSILLYVKNKYIYIGWDIYSFTIPKGEQIIKYYSNLGNQKNNLISYPIAVSENYLYFMVDNSYCDKKLFNTLNDKYLINTYSEFYGQCIKCKQFDCKCSKNSKHELIKQQKLISDNCKPFKNYKLIYDRI